MISIKESNDQISDLFKEHTNFVAPYVKLMIDFYLDFFKELPKIQHKRTSDKIAVNSIMAIKRKYNVGHYKRLLKYTLKGKTPLDNDSDLKLFKFENHLCNQAKKNKVVIATLTHLLQHYRAIIEFEINGYKPGKIAQYDSWKLTYDPIKFLLKGIFDYDDWFLSLATTEKWGPYQLATRLDIKSCPYCNRSYTFSLTDSGGVKKGRPDFDHFMPKTSNQLLALSFFNLIPSCKICNGPSVKSSKSVSYETHFNPYEDNVKSGLMRFTYYPNNYEASVGMSEDLEIALNYSGDSSDNRLQTKIKGNISLFYLDDTYKHHTDIVQEIIRKRTISNDRYIEELQNTYSHLNLSVEEAYRIAFGNYYNEKDFHKRPIAKLTKDIAIEMGTLITVDKDL